MKRSNFVVMALLITLSTLGFADYCRLLIVCDEEFSSSIDDFVQWKYETGWKPMVCEIPSDLSVAAEIKSEMIDFIDDLDEYPEHILIVGDDSFIPHGYHNGASSDAFYADFDSDNRADVSIARFPANTTAELRSIIKKTMHYAQNPEIDGDYDWLKRAALFHDTHNHHYECIMDTIQYELEGRSYSVNRYRSTSSPSDTEILNGINNGYGYVIFRGEGVDHWGSFYCLEPDRFANGYKTPIVSGTTCSTLRSYGPSWLTAGTVENPKGGVVYIGSGTVGSSTDLMMQRSAMADGFLYGFLDGMVTGDAVQNGRAFVLDYGGSSYEREYSSLFMMGDPTMWVWTDIPQEVSVSYPPIFIGGEDGEFTINVSLLGAPVQNALCCAIVGEYVYEWGYTDDDGNFIVEYYCPVDCTDSMLISVTGHNILPQKHYINRLFETSRPFPSKIWLDDTPHGNGDSLLSRNETCNIKMNVRNLGSVPSSEITIIISTESPSVEITDSISIVPALDSLEEVFATDDFEFNVLEDARVGDHINFDITLRTDTDEFHNTWISPVIIGGNLALDRFTILDPEPWGNENSKLNSGETALIQFYLENIGSAQSEDITLEFSSISDEISLINGHHHVSILELGQTDTLLPMTIQCTANSLLLDSAEIMCEITAYESGMSMYTMVETLSISYFGYSSGVTGPGEYGYYIYDYTDTHTGQSPEYEWFDISEIGTRSSTLSDAFTNVEHFEMPFDFQFYGEEYDMITITSEGCVFAGVEDFGFRFPERLPTDYCDYPIIAASFVDITPMWHGDIYTYYDETHGKYYIQYSEVEDFEFNHISFQIVITDQDMYSTPTEDNDIFFYYLDSLPDPGTVIGIQSEDAEMGISYRESGTHYLPSAAPIIPESALRITTVPPNVPGDSQLLFVNDVNISVSYGDTDSQFEEGESLTVELEIKNMGELDAENIEVILYDIDEDIIFGVKPDTLRLDHLNVGESHRFTHTLSFEITYTLVEKDGIFAAIISSNSGSYENIQPIAIPVKFNMDVEESAPNNFELAQAYPNPFNSSINFELPSEHSIIEIYSTNGKLLERHTPQAQSFTLDWHSSEYSTGVYLYKIITDNKEQSGKVVYIK